MNELIHIKTNGVLVGSKRHLKTLNIRAFSCDAPARSFLSEVMEHASIHGCSKCTQIGTKPHLKAVMYSTEISSLRTDETFRNRMHKIHHHTHFQTRQTALETAGIGMVSQFPIEPMHLVDLGAVKKILTLIATGKVKGYRVNHENISCTLLSLKTFVPREFQRLPRSLSVLAYWKATEFRQFILYTGIVVLKDSVNSEIYEHFLTLHAAIRMMACPKTCRANVHVSQNLLQNFVDNFATLYGADKLSFNIHNLLHICDCVKQFGPIDSFSAYKFENMMQYLKKKIHRPSQILQQLRNRMEEMYCADVHKTNYSDLSTSKFKLNEFELNCNKEADRYCLIKAENPIMITKFDNNNKVYGYKCLNISPFFTFQ